MSPHAYYERIRPAASLHAMPTCTPLRVKLLRFRRWLALFMCLVLMVLGAATTIAGLNMRQAQLDTAFLQGMAAGHQLCPRGL